MSALHQCPELVVLGLQGVRIRLINGQNIKYMGSLLDSVFTLINYCNQPEGIADKASKYKSSIRNYDGDEEENVVVWDESFDLGIFYSLETCVRVRLFEYKIARADMFISEVTISLEPLINEMLQKATAKRLESGAPPLPEGEVEDVKGMEVVKWHNTKPRELHADTGGQILLGISFY